MIPLPSSRWELKHPQIACGSAFAAGTLIGTGVSAIAFKANALLLLKNAASVAIVGGLFTTLTAASYDFSKFSESDFREQHDLTAILTRLFILFISTASCSTSLSSYISKKISCESITLLQGAAQTAMGLVTGANLMVVGYALRPSRPEISSRCRFAGAGHRLGSA